MFVEVIFVMIEQIIMKLKHYELLSVMNGGNKKTKFLIEMSFFGFKLILIHTKICSDSFPILLINKNSCFCVQFDLFYRFVNESNEININWNFFSLSYILQQVFKVQYVENDKIWAINFDIKPWIYLSALSLLFSADVLLELSWLLPKKATTVRRFSINKNNSTMNGN